MLDAVSVIRATHIVFRCVECEHSVVTVDGLYDFGKGSLLILAPRGQAGALAFQDRVCGTSAVESKT